MSIFKNVSGHTLILPRDDGKGGSRELRPNQEFTASNFYKSYLTDPETDTAQLQLVSDDGDEQWGGPGGYMGKGLKNPLLAPNLITRYAYVQAADEDDLCYMTGSKGEVKVMKVFLSGAEVGDLAKKTCYYYQDPTYPTKVTRIEQMDDEVTAGDLLSSCLCKNLPFPSGYPSTSPSSSPTTSPSASPSSSPSASPSGP